MIPWFRALVDWWVGVLICSVLLAGFIVVG